MIKVSMLCVLAAFILGSCYQAHSGDDLRTIPVTNNPMIVPQNNRGPMAGL
jgi:hypothetical protein